MPGNVLCGGTWKIVEGQRSQQHGVDDAEDGCVGADAEREDRDDGQRERRRPEQRSGAIAKVGQEGLHDRISRGWLLGRSRQRSGQASDGLAPEPSARRGRRHRGAGVKLFFEVADHELAPLRAQPIGEEPDGEPRRRLPRRRSHAPLCVGRRLHFTSSRASKPPAIAVKAR